MSDPKDYKWTSYPAYIGLAPKGFLKPEVILGQFGHGRAACRAYEMFVRSGDEGPIDWSSSSESFIGDEDFVESLKLSEDMTPENWAGKDLVEVVSRELDVGRQLVMDPRGRYERRLRHKAFAILVEKYGLSAAEVGRVFGVSTMAVTKVLRKGKWKSL